METPYLSVVIPAFREERRIGNVLTAAIDFFRKRQIAHEIIVVDDGSTDATADVARTFQERDPSVRIIRFDVNRGKGAAVRAGMEAAKGTYALFADADNSTPFAELTKLLPRAEAGDDIVMGSRYLPESNVVKRQPWTRRAMSRIGNALFRTFLRLPFHDTRCGFKLFNRRARALVFSKQTLERFGFDTEILVIAGLHGLTVREVPVTWIDDANDPKARFRDSFRSLHEIWIIFKKKHQGVYA